MKRALVSVTNKDGIVDFCKGLVDLGFEIVSTGGTMAKLQAENVPCIAIAAERIIDGPPISIFSIISSIGLPAFNAFSNSYKLTQTTSIGWMSIFLTVSTCS